MGNYHSEQTADIRTFVFWSAGIGLAMVALSLLLVFFNTNQITKPLQNITVAAQHMAQGDTSVRLDIQRKDEIGLLAASFTEMAEASRRQAEFVELVATGDYRSEIPVRSEQDVINKAMNAMVASNNEMIARVRVSSDQVSSASGQIAQAAQTLATGSTEQAASVDEFATTLGGVLNQTKENAANAQSALA